MPAGRTAAALFAAALASFGGACRSPEASLGDPAACARRGICSGSPGGSQGSPGGEPGAPGGGRAGATGGRASDPGGSDAGGSAGGAGEAGTGSDPVRPGFTEVRCRSLVVEGPCAVSGTGSELVVSGDVLTPAHAYLGGELRIHGDGTIACVGCDCSEGPEARRITCPGAIVAPAFVNPHDHIAYAHQAPRPLGPERYEHRHDWRLGLRGHAAIAYEGGASPAARAAHELRMLLDGVTAIAGGAGHAGLLRNLDVPGLEEGVRVAPADSDTFPLDDADGLFVRSGCAYGAGRTRPAEIERFGAYLPHLGEGIDEEAENELRCALEPPLVTRATAVVHAIAVDPTLARALGARHALVVWSPRSNLALYGNTAPVTLLRRSGVELALGTDWLLSGSMTMRRELACARSFSRTYLDGALDDRALYTMATASAARAAGASLALGRLAVGAFADLQVVRRRGLEPHTAIVTAEPADVLLVLRAGTALYGDAPTLEALGGDGCEPLGVCGAPKRVCLGETGKSLAELVAATPYPLVACGTPPDEPSCVPERPAEYDGTVRADDTDGDGVPNDLDDCPRVFDPPRPLDAGRQADADGDGIGDACDDCPSEPSPSCSARIDDGDGDGVSDPFDDCPLEPDAAQRDDDTDGAGDPCDFCASPNPGVVPCSLPVVALRDQGHAEHPPRHGLVELDGVTVVAVRPNEGSSRGYTVIDDTRAFSGIFVFTGASPPGVSTGDRVSVRGRLDVYQGTDELVGATLLERVPGGSVVSPVVVNAGDVGDDGSLSERYASMLVRVEAVAVENQNPDAPSDYDELLLSGSLRLDDLLAPELDNDFTVGTRFASVTGILGFSFGHWKLWPRGVDDVVRE